MSNRAFGFKPTRHLTGGVGGKHTQRFQKSTSGSDAELIYVGDPIKLNSDGTVSRWLVADVSAAAGQLIGVAAGFKNGSQGRAKTHGLPDQQPTISLTADTDWVEVYTDPHQVYEVVANATATQALIGAAFNVDVTARTTAAGISGYKLDAASSARAENPFQVVGISPLERTLTSAASGRVEVIVNNGLFKTNSQV